MRTGASPAARSRTRRRDPATRAVFRIDKEFAWLVAVACASVGDADEALDWLSAAVDMGFINHRFFAEHDPFLAALRRDPRFEALMDRARELQRAWSTGNT